MAGSGITRSIYDRVINSFDGMTRQELKSSLNLTSDQVRCRTNDLVKAGKLVVVNDDLGVSRYYANREEKEMKPAIKEPVATPSTKAWDQLIQEAEQRGFAKGYTVGVQEAQRAAYELGKSAVISKLTAVLS